MISVTDLILVGDSDGERTANVEAILNVAKDLPPTRSWPDIEYVHIGLVDGPGNTLSAYYAAVLALDSLRSIITLVCCHEGGRAVAVALMYLGLKTQHNWTQCLNILRERNECEIPEPHVAHRQAFEKMDWSWLQCVSTT